jgi:hypothetical protein
VLRRSKVDAAYEEIVPIRRICSCAACSRAAIAGGYCLRPTKMRRHSGLLYVFRQHGDSRLCDVVPSCKLSGDSTCCVRRIRLQLWLVLASIGQHPVAGGKAPNIQACQQQCTPHAGGPVLRELCCDSGSKIIRRRGCRRCPQEHPLPALQNLNLSLQFQRI